MKARCCDDYRFSRPFAFASAFTAKSRRVVVGAAVCPHITAPKVDKEYGNASGT